MRAEVAEVVLVGLDAARTKLVIELWTPQDGVRTLERA
jgi:hypothetical protein